jgi:hypothetical protein
MTEHGTTSRGKVQLEVGGQEPEWSSEDAGERKQALALSQTVRGKIGGARLRDEAYPRRARMM